MFFFLQKKYNKFFIISIYKKNLESRISLFYLKPYTVYLKGLSTRNITATYMTCIKGSFAVWFLKGTEHFTSQNALTLFISNIFFLT